MEEKKVLPDEIELPEIVLSKSNHAFEMIRQESVNMKKEKNRRIFKSQVAAIAGVCLLAISGITVVAAVHHYWGRGMKGNIQATEIQQQELTDQGVAVVYPEKENYEALEVVQNGISITPNTVIVDDRFAYITFTIAGYDLEEGKDPGFENVSVDSKDVYLNMSGSMYGGIVSDENGEPVYEDGTKIAFGDDGSIIYHYSDENGNLEYYMQVFVAEEDTSLLGKKLNIKLENLGTLYKAEFTNEKDGLWEFDIELPAVSSATHYDVNKQVEGTSFSVTDVDISPISMKVNYVTSTEMEMKDDEIGVPVIKGVVLTDGTRLPYLADGGSVGYSDTTHAYNITGYDRVIDVEEVKALLILVEPGKELVAVDIQ